MCVLEYNEIPAAISRGERCCATNEGICSTEKLLSYLTQVTSSYGDPWPVSMELHFTAVEKECDTIHGISQHTTKKLTLSLLPRSADFPDILLSYGRKLSLRGPHLPIRPEISQPLALPPLQHHSKDDIFLAHRRKGDTIQGTETVAILSFAGTRNLQNWWF